MNTFGEASVDFRPWSSVHGLWSRVPRSVRLIGLALACVAGPAAPAAGEFWDQRGVKVIQTLEMRFPPSLLLNGITRGQVQAVLEVDAEGKLADFLIVGFTQPELGAELQRSLPAFEFEPARERGEPIRCRFEAVFGFEARGAVISLTPMASVSSHLRDTLGESLTLLLARPSEMDQPLAIIHQIAPFHPGRSLLPPLTTGTAKVDFYIDANGRPRMPVVVGATREEFGAAAVEALLQWRFAAPTSRGRPVVVRVVQEFVFSAGAPAPGRSS